ncbi:hypothetical protein KRX56_04565 [Dermabacteraceae bacterium TAE3-ERU27]|nr:hypothetical protein [Dermabacteraceae bacterium TAE3-ERU27]
MKHIYLWGCKLLGTIIDEKYKGMPSEIPDGHYKMVEINGDDVVFSCVPVLVKDLLVFMYYPSTDMWHLEEEPSRYTIVPDYEEFIFVPTDLESLIALMKTGRKIPRRGSGVGHLMSLESQPANERKFNAEVGLFRDGGKIFKKEMVKVLGMLESGDTRLVARYPEAKRTNALTLAGEINAGKKAMLAGLSLKAEAFQDKDGTWVVSVTKQ